jgi:hypothetical protein
MKVLLALNALLLLTALATPGSAQEAAVSEAVPKPAPGSINGGLQEPYSAPYQLHAQDGLQQGLSVISDAADISADPADVASEPLDEPTLASEAPLPSPPPPDPAGVSPNGGYAGSDEVATNPNIASGAEAIRRLGDDLAEVAAAYDRTAEELASLLATDPDLYIDRNNMLFYMCQLAPPDQISAPEAAAEDANIGHHHHHHRKLQQSTNADAADPLASTLPQSASGVPILHSRPTSGKKIYLDFDGHTTTGDFDVCSTPTMLSKQRFVVPLWSDKKRKGVLSLCLQKAICGISMLCRRSTSYFHYPLQRAVCISTVLCREHV